VVIEQPVALSVTVTEYAPLAVTVIVLFVLFAPFGDHKKELFTAVFANKLIDLMVQLSSVPPVTV
jgi:hypothetical protein